MEHSYNGRAIINEGLNGLEIIIPVKKNWYGIICILGCTVVWLLCDIALIAGFTGHLGQRHSGNEFAIYFLIWNLILFHCVRTLLWSLRGKEIITVGQGQLTIQRKGDILYRRKVYETSEVNNIRIQNGAVGLKDIFTRRNTSGPFTIDGTLEFNYGVKTIKFALGMEIKEAVIIIEKMKDYGIG